MLTAPNHNWKQYSYLVTGGSSGLGAATARHIEALGGTVTIADLQPPSFETQAAFVKTDVTQEADIKQAIETTTGKAPLFGLINCAGIAKVDKMLRKKRAHSMETFELTVRVNLLGSFNFARLAALAMADNEADSEGQRGVIINTASVAAFEGQTGQVAYSASKGGVAAMTLPMARDLAEYGIRAVTIAPGMFETAMTKGANKIMTDLLTEETFPPRLGKAEEFASLVEAIIKNPMLNGETIRLDGGIRMKKNLR